MAVNTSATGGYLAPAASPAPAEGVALWDFVHDIIAGVTGMDATLVRPAWQPEPPNLPDYGTTWCAFRIGRRVADFNAFIEHDGDDPGSDELQRHENLEVQTMFYSSTPDDADEMAAVLREGLQIPQNLAALQLAQWGLIETGDTNPAPTLTKDRWLYRIDMPIRFRRLITRVYPVLNLLSARATLYTDTPALVVPMVITNPVTP